MGGVLLLPLREGSGRVRPLPGRRVHAFDLADLAEQNWVRDLNLQLNEAAEFLQVAPWGAQDVERLERWGRVKPPICPNCGHRSAKVGNNNHIRCWACTSSFCALCLKVLRKGDAATHFSPSGCKQHTAD